MIESTRGIVLTHTKYAETSVIAHIYTEKFGLQSYMVNQVRSKKSKGKTIFLQPLSLVDLEVYHNEKKTIHRIKDFKLDIPFTMIPFEPVRRSMSFFIAEVLNKALKHEDKLSDELYQFLYHFIIVFDSEINGVQNLHLFLLFNLTKMLGFYPHFDMSEQKKYFDLRTGNFTNTIPDHPHYMQFWQTELLYQMQQLNLENIHTLKLKGSDRTLFIEKLLEFYHLHLSGFSKIKSFEVLKDLFS